MKRIALLVWLTFSLVCAQAASTAAWEMSRYEDFVTGRFSGLSLSRDGRLMLAPDTETLFNSDQPVIWSVAQAADGTLYAGTGHRGRVFQIEKSGKSSVLWTADDPEVFAVALDPKGVLYAATSPKGKIYRIENGKATEFFAPQAVYIWSLVFAKDGTLYVGTGDQGKIFRVEPSGQGKVYYETGQLHVTSLALDPDGRLLAGTEPNGILYRIWAKDKAFVLYDADLPEIRAIAAMPDGVIYAAAQGGASTRRAVTGAPSTPGMPKPQVGAVSTSITVTDEAQSAVEIKPKPEAKPAQPVVTPMVASQFNPMIDIAGIEKSALYKISADNTVETLWTSKEENVYDLLPRGSQIVFATDGKGRIYSLDRDRKATLLVQTNEGEATRLVESDGGLLAATGDAGKIFRLGDQTGPSGVYESPVHDAGTVARWGRLNWRAETGEKRRIVFRTRSGNSARPDKTWSDWSEPLKDPTGSVVHSPNARYIQWKAEFAGEAGQTPVLNSVTLPYLPQNTPPLLKSIQVTSQMLPQTSTTQKATAQQAATSSYSITVTDTGEAAAATSSGTPTQTVSGLSGRQMQIAWQAEDPDGDKLVYTLYFRGEDEREWKLIKENLYDTTVQLDGDVLADGKYFFRVVASDLPANPPGRAREVELVSSPILVDNTPPLVTAGTARKTAVGTEVQFNASDAASALRRAEYSVDAGPWIPVEAADGVIDSPTEHFVLELKNLLPGEHLVVLRVYDAAENVGLGKVVLR